MGQNVQVLGLNGITEPIEAAFAEDELEARLVLVAAVAMDVEDPDDGFDAGDDLLGGDEFVQQAGFGGQRAQAAGYGHTEAADAVDDLGAQADVVDGCRHAVFGASREGYFELAREAIGQLLVQEGEGQAAGVGLDIKRLVG